MFKKINPKPLTIEEYKKNYKFPEKEGLSLEDEYIHLTQKNFISNIIKNKLKMKNNVIKIEKDEDINKTLENIFKKQESRERILSILKRRNHNLSLISDRYTLSKSNTKDISHDSLFNKFKLKKSFDFNTPIKKNDKLNLPIKKQSAKPLIPLLIDKKRKKEKSNDKIDTTINKNNNTTTKKILIKKNDEIHTSHFYLETEPNKGKYNLKFKKNNKIQKTDKNNNTNNNDKNKEKPKKSFRKSYKPNKKNINLKIEKNCQIILIKKIKTIQKKYIQDKREEMQILKQIKNIQNKLIKEKGEEIQILKKMKSENNIYKQEKGEEIQILTKIKNAHNVHNKYIQEKREEIQILTKNGDIGKELKNYTGYILIKQKMGENIEKINLDKNENNIKELLLNVINELSEEQNEIITKNELLILNETKKEINIKELKINEQKLLIEKEKKLYLDLKNEFDKLILENNNLKEKISSLEIKENELKEININFTEYKKQKSEEIQNFEILLKQKENELNKIKQEKNDIRKYNIEKQNELFIEKLLTQKIDTSISNRNSENNKKLKDAKISKILDKIKKKKSNEINNDEQNTIKKTDKINQLRKMLEQQIKSENKENEKSKEKINQEEIENTNKK